MTVVLIMAGLTALWLVKQVASAVVGQQIKGSIPDYTQAKAKAAASLLPAELAESYLEDWLAELRTLENKPMSAVGFALGLSSAARAIAAASGIRVPQTGPQATLTRCTDIAFSIVTLVFLAPLFSATSLAVFVVSGAPILEEKEYLGQDGRPYRQLRFRTAFRDREGRETPVGSVLRRFSLDALPLLLSVLRGEMAIVGPRGVSVEDLGLRPNSCPAFSAPSERPSIRPGIASWEAMAGWGVVELTADEARLRDTNRSRRQDLALLWHVSRHLLTREPPAS